MATYRQQEIDAIDPTRIALAEGQKPMLLDARWLTFLLKSRR